ncbi:MAG: Fur family transcriptional regulator [Chloroflexota bacterium]
MNNNPDPKTLLDIWLNRLNDSGYRVTARNHLIVEIILSSHKALDPITIYDLARKEQPGLGLVTIYRTLQKLEELGLVERLHQPDGCNRFLRATCGHEHVLVCSQCGQVDYFGGDDLNHLFEGISEQTGFVIETHWLQLFGVCPACQNGIGI